MQLVEILEPGFTRFAELCKLFGKQSLEIKFDLSISECFEVQEFEKRINKRKETFPRLSEARSQFDAPGITRLRT